MLSVEGIENLFSCLTPRGEAVTRVVEALAVASWRLDGA